MADIVKSTKVTRTALVKKLKQGLLASPGETSLSEALDIVGEFEWDGSESDLGIMIAGMIR